MEFILFIIAAFVIIKIIEGLTSGDNNEEASHKEVVKTVTSNPPPTTEPDPPSPPQTPKDKPIQLRETNGSKSSANNKRYMGKGSPSAKFLEKCIDNDETISFTYIDNDGVITERTVTPEKIFWGYSNRAGDGTKIRTCWVKAHCHMRNASRTFIKDKMSKVSVE